MSLWMTHLLSCLPTALCNIKQCLYKLVLYEHLEYMQNICIFCCSGWDVAMEQLPRPKTGQDGGGGDQWRGGLEQQNENNPGNWAVRPESAGISSYLAILCQWDSFVLETCCYSVTSQDCCSALKWNYFCASISRSRWIPKSAKETHSWALFLFNYTASPIQ